MAANKLNKNQWRRAKKKAEKDKAEKKEPSQDLDPTTRNTDAKTEPADDQETEKPDTDDIAPKNGSDVTDQPNKADNEPVVVETDDLDEFVEDPAYAQFRQVFERFGADIRLNDQNQQTAGGDKDKGTVFNHDDDDIPSEDEGSARLSKKKRKQLSKLTVAELKALAPVPEVVEWHDVSSPDPRLLVQIKGQRNVVPVPTHWTLKREYLSSKRGIEKAAFRLPQFITDTGITEMRDAVLEKQDGQTLKQKQRERVAPKMGRLDIDYRKLHDAFFRFQSKPDLTRYGEVYYEGKEVEVDYKGYRPGELSDETKEALGMSLGAPPPWLINQQRIGPPPSYPTLKIPGLNAPPPPGASWGFHPGGWGRPPVDDFNRPLFGGDVFGLTANGVAAGGGPAGGPAVAAGQGPGVMVPAAGAASGAQPLHPGEPIQRGIWGELQAREAESEEDEDSSDEDDDEDGSDGEAAANDDTAAALAESGLETPAAGTLTSTAGIQSSIAGEMDLRKVRRGIESEQPRAAYTILQEKHGRAEGFFGSERTYDIARAPTNMATLGHEDDSRKRKKPGDVDVAIDVDSLQHNGGLSKDEVRKRFDEGARETGPGAQWANFDEDLGNMIAQESRKRIKTDQQNKEKRRDGKFKF